MLLTEQTDLILVLLLDFIWGCRYLSGDILLAFERITVKYKLAHWYSTHISFLKIFLFCGYACSNRSMFFDSHGTTRTNNTLVANIGPCNHHLVFRNIYLQFNCRANLARKFVSFDWRVHHTESNKDRICLGNWSSCNACI